MIADVQVGGISPAAARAAVLALHVAPRRAALPVTFRGRTLAINPVKAGYTADVDYAVQVAMIYGRSRPVPPEGVVVPLKEKVNTTKLRAILKLRAKANDLPARDASVTLKGVTPGRPQAARRHRHRRAEGDRPDRRRDRRARPTRATPSPSHRVLPARTSVGAIVVIDRGNFRLTWYKGKRKLSFPIAVGQPAFPTPTGNFQVIQKQVNPTWFPPSSPVGRRPRPGPARREQPARHPLDRHLRAGDRDARHPGLVLHRHPRLPRLHPDVHLRRREALPPRSTSGPPSTSG